MFRSLHNQTVVASWESVRGKIAETLRKLRVPRAERQELEDEAVYAVYLRLRLPPQVENVDRYARAVTKNLVAASYRLAHERPQLLPADFVVDLPAPQRDEDERHQPTTDVNLLTITNILRPLLSPREDRVFMLHYVEGRPIMEVARELGLARQQVKRAADRVLRKVHAHRGVFPLP